MVNVLRPGVAAGEAAWAELVRLNREQVERLRERPEETDFWKSMSGIFRADPRRTGDAVLDGLLALVRPGETWLDVGAGGGRFALPIAQRAGRVIAVEPSASMRQVLREGMAEHGIDNIEIIEGVWEEVEAPVADVALIANVGYDIDEIGPFLDRLETHARRLCVAVMLDRQPASLVGGLWQELFGEPQALLPALREFVPLQFARDRLVEVKLVPSRPWVYETKEEAISSLRWRFWVTEGSERDRRLLALLDRDLRQTDGAWSIPGPRPYTGIVTWTGRAS